MKSSTNQTETQLRAKAKATDPTKLINLASDGEATSALLFSGGAAAGGGTLSVEEEAGGMLELSDCGAGDPVSGARDRVSGAGDPVSGARDRVSGAGDPVCGDGSDAIEVGVGALPPGLGLSKRN
ncbi:hypothetical protein AMTR_s00119p00120380 [Amborella trichopoda]|uniref:Uncharacterized protein n=1 Tax=Amborella trichopoda TaxID=13333 RepID=W1NQ70_AMBTC|nr:hypothetical protein AMTR_s00119p00120380 [Amborella trichopoda]